MMCARNMRRCANQHLSIPDSGKSSFLSSPYEIYIYMEICFAACEEITLVFKLKTGHGRKERGSVMEDKGNITWLRI